MCCISIGLKQIVSVGMFMSFSCLRSQKLYSGSVVQSCTSRQFAFRVIASHTRINSLVVLRAFISYGKGFLYIYCDVVSIALKQIVSVGMLC